jgi:hypothetical protein
MKNCPHCGGKGYIEIETGVTDGPHKDMIKELCDCQICRECGKELDQSSEYHQEWGTCSSYCYGKLVGVHW